MVQVRRDEGEAELAGQPEIGARHLQRGIMGAENGKAQGHQPIIAREGLPPQPLDFGAGMGHFGEMGFAGLGVGLGRAVEEGGADAAFRQRFHRCVRMGGGGVVVAPIHQRRCAGIDLAIGAHEGGDADVVRPEAGGKARMHPAEIFQERPVGG